MELKEWLINQKACRYAIKWVGDRTLEQAWAECDRGDWMLWLAQEVEIDLKMRTFAKVRCARLAEHLMTDQRSLDALYVAERFGRGEATLEELADAARAAYAAAYAAGADAYDDAYAAGADAYDAAYADYAAAAHAADAAARAADAGAGAADTAACAAARSAAAYAASAVSDTAVATLKECADIIRETIDFNLIKDGVANVSCFGCVQLKCY